MPERRFMPGQLDWLHVYMQSRVHWYQLWNWWVSLILFHFILLLIHVIIIIVASYIALRSVTQWRSKRFQHYYPWSLGLKSFLKPSQLPVEYTACATKYVAQSRLINHKNQLYHNRYPFTPGWREAIIVKCPTLRWTESTELEFGAFARPQHPTITGMLVQ